VGELGYGLSEAGGASTMRDKPAKWLEKFRDVNLSSAGDGNNGHFRIPCGDAVLSVIVSDGLGWDHASVSLPDRTPTWAEMCYIKKAFFRGDECVMQLHPPEANYVNHHPFCLHLWRPQEVDVPQPPLLCV
jgi:hypothetical protein